LIVLHHFNFLDFYAFQQKLKKISKKSKIEREERLKNGGKMCRENAAKKTRKTRSNVDHGKLRKHVEPKPGIKTTRTSLRNNRDNRVKLK
jgi:hypothetical protein